MVMNFMLSYQSWLLDHGACPGFPSLQIYETPRGDIPPLPLSVLAPGDCDFLAMVSGIAVEIDILPTDSYVV